MHPGAVIFDLYDTLIFIDPDSFDRRRRETADALGCDPERVNEIWSRHSKDRFLGRIRTVADMAAVLLDELNIARDSELIRKIESIERSALLDNTHADSETPEILEKIKTAGMKIALLSNASEITKDVIQLLPWTALFDHILLSCDVGLVKPDAAIYEMMLDALKTPAAECLFVGDGGSMELEGAHAVGIKTVRLENPGRHPLIRRGEYYDFKIASLRELLEILHLE